MSKSAPLPLKPLITVKLLMMIALSTIVSFSAPLPLNTLVTGSGTRVECGDYLGAVTGDTFSQCSGPGLTYIRADASAGGFGTSFMSGHAGVGGTALFSGGTTTNGGASAQANWMQSLTYWGPAFIMGFTVAWSGNTFVSDGVPALQQDPIVHFFGGIGLSPSQIHGVGGFIDRKRSGSTSGRHTILMTIFNGATIWMQAYASMSFILPPGPVDLEKDELITVNGLHSMDVVEITGVPVGGYFLDPEGKIVNVSDIVYNPIPEPTSFAMVAVSFLLLFALKRRFRTPEN